MRCLSILPSSIFWLLVASLAFNVYTTSQNWPTTDPTLLMVNVMSLFSMIIMAIFNIISCICSRRSSKATASNSFFNSSSSKVTLDEWVEKFEALAKFLPQQEMQHDSHDDDCNCFKECTHSTTTCRVVDTSAAPVAVNGQRKKLLYKRLTLTQHAATCNCKCFAKADAEK